MHIPATVIEIDPAFFQLFPNAAEITVAEENPTYKTYNGMLFDAALTSLLLVPEGMEGNAVLPSSIASVPACAFSRCTKLSAIAIQGSTANSAFATQDGILYTSDMATLVATPAGLGISAIVAPECTTIAEGAFQGNTDLQTIIVKGNVEAIASNAFSPETVASATVVLPFGEDRTVWEAAGFKAFEQPVEVGATFTSEDKNFAFTVLPDYTLSVAWNGEAAAPSTVAIPDYAVANGARYSVTQVAESGFAGLPIQAVQMPASLTKIGTDAFAGCAELQTATLNDGLRTISQGAFSNTAMRTVVIPASVELVETNAFGGMDNLTVIAKGSVGVVSKQALGSSMAANIYMPYREDGNYAWTIGLPTSGTHLYPYGVKINPEALNLSIGETTNLFINGGYLKAPGNITVNYKYSAKNMSVDTETGDVTAKRSGNTSIDVTLSLPVEEKVSQAPSAAALAPATYNGGAKTRTAAYTFDARTKKVAAIDEIVKKDIQIAGDTLSGTTEEGEAYEQINQDMKTFRSLAISKARANALSTTSPIQITFGDTENGNNGIDVSSGSSQLNKTWDASFNLVNNGAVGVQLDHIEFTDNKVSEMFEGTINTDFLKLASNVADLSGSDATKTVVWNGQGSQVNLVDPTHTEETITAQEKALQRTFKISKGKNQTWSLRLNLQNTEFKKASTANGAAEAFATVKWVFSAMSTLIPGNGDTTGIAVNDVKSNDGIYLKILDEPASLSEETINSETPGLNDRQREVLAGCAGQIYNLSDIKEHSKTLAQSNENTNNPDENTSDLYTLYSALTDSLMPEGDYECMVEYKGAYDGGENTMLDENGNPIKNWDFEPGTTAWPVRVVGLNQDTPANTATYGANRVGLTFQFLDCISRSKMGDSSLNIGGWSGTCASLLRGKLSTGGTYFKNLTIATSGNLVLVDKKSDAGNRDTTTVNTTEEQLFLPSYRELVGKNNSAYTQSCIVNSGTGANFTEQYRFYQNKEIPGTLSNGNNSNYISCKWLRKGLGPYWVSNAINGFSSLPTYNQGVANSTSAVTSLSDGNTSTLGTMWWERTTRPADNGDFLYVRHNGNPNDYNDTYFLTGVCPCFCL